MRKKKQAAPPFSPRDFLRSAAPRAAHAAVAAHERNESILGAVMDALATEGHAAISKSAHEWVKGERGRKAVLEWEGDGVVLRHLRPDGTPR